LLRPLQELIQSSFGTWSSVSSGMPTWQSPIGEILTVFQSRAVSSD
jgi:poly(3-hydroxybutyrate) depolymerase